jgi:hypothetical protein
METHIIGITHVIQLAVAAIFSLSELASRRCGFVSIERFRWNHDSRDLLNDLR